MTTNRLRATTVSRPEEDTEPDLSDAQWRKALAAYATRPADLIDEGRSMEWTSKNGDSITVRFRPGWNGAAVTATAVSRNTESEEEAERELAVLTLQGKGKEFQNLARYLRGEGPSSEERMRMAALALDEYEAEVSGLSEAREEAYRLEKYDWAAGTEDTIFEQATNSVRRIRTLLATGIDLKTP